MSAVPSSDLHLQDGDRRPGAVVYCEGNFARIDGKTANGLVRHSETYRILAVIDSTMAGQDAGLALDGLANGIPVVADLAAATSLPGTMSLPGTRSLPASMSMPGSGSPPAPSRQGRAVAPSVLIIGLAPSSGLLGDDDRTVVLEAMARGLDIVNGLHEFLNDDEEFGVAALAHDVQISDVRRPAATKHLRMFTGRIAEVTCPVIAILGTDGAIGKRTTATIVTAALVDAGLAAVMVSTGQTGLIQGARFGVALDAIPAQFGIGELEATVVEAHASASPDVIIVEGQGALSHPAYISSTIVLRGSRPDGVILQHAPARRMLSDFPTVPMPTPASEIDLIQTFADTRVIGMTLNHESMTDVEVSAAIIAYEAELGIPVTDALTRPAERLVDMVLQAFPQLQRSPALTER